MIPHRQPASIFLELSHATRLVRVAKCVGLVVAIGSTIPPSAHAFEVESGYVAGESIETYEGWSASIPGQAVIVTTERASGDQALEIPPAEDPIEITFEAPSGAPTTAVRFITVSVKPVAVDPTHAQSVLHAWGADLGFVVGENGVIELVIADGEGRSIVTAARQSPGQGADRWVHLMIRQDLEAGIWDLYLDDQLVAINQKLNSEAGAGFAVFGHTEFATYVGALAVSASNPLFLDTDADGIPDAWELAHSLNPYINDRLADPRGDGISNIQRYLLSLQGGANGGGLGATHFLYVDNAHGDDAASGFAPYAARGAEFSGPKASLKAAMAAARDGDTIIVLPGTGLYDEGSRSAEGKQLTIKTLGKITIR